jgi:hypothetical protein
MHTSIKTPTTTQQQQQHQAMKPKRRIESTEIKTRNEKKRRCSNFVEEHKKNTVS